MNTIQECSLITTNELASHLEGSQRLQLLIAKLSEIRRALISQETEFRGRITAAHPAYRRSVANLIHYLALRRHDIQLLQEELAVLGLSSLGRAESHTLWTLDAVLNILRHLSGRHQQSPFPSEAIGFAEGGSMLAAHTEALLGRAPPHRERNIRQWKQKPTV
jgi:pyruvate kinase